MQARLLLLSMQPEESLRAMRQIEKQLRNYRLTTAEITYHLPDYPELLQNFIWQEFDLAPEYPMLRRFLRFWQGNLDGRLHSVNVAATTLLRPSQVRFSRSLSSIH